MAHSTKKKVRIDLYFDVVSPYAWIGFESLTRYRHRWSIDLHLRPFFLGGVMKASANSPPMMVPAKARYMPEDVIRQRNYWGIPLNQPSNFPEKAMVKGTILAQRFLTAIELKQPNYLESAARELWMRMWSRDESVHMVEDLQQVAKKISLPDADRLIKMCDSDEVKNRLKASTEEAIEKGAFGAPWIVVTTADGVEHSFWGSDRLYLIGDLIGEQFQGHLKEYSKL